MAAADGGLVLVEGMARGGGRATTARQRVDAERLLRWTYGQQQAHLARRAARQWLAEVEPDLVEDRFSCLFVSGEMARSIASGAPAVARSALHPDAEWVHAQVLATLDGEEAGLVQLQARLGNPPDWIEDTRFGLSAAWIDPAPARGPRYETERTPEGYVVAPLQRWGTWPDEVAAARARYLRWWAASTG